MKKLIFTLMAFMTISITASAQDVAQSTSTEVAENYNITIPTSSLERFLGLTAPAVKKVDKWQNELQAQINEAVKKQGAERSQALNTSISTYLVTMKSYLRSEEYEKYLSIFQSSLKNKHLDEMMQ